MFKLFTCHNYIDDTSQDVSDKSVDIIEYKLKEDRICAMEWIKKQ